MEIEDFQEQDFYEVEIPENMFKNLIQLESNVYGEFHLPEDIFQEDQDDIIIVEHNDIYNNPIYRSSDNYISDEDDEY